MMLRQCSRFCEENGSGRSDPELLGRICNTMRVGSPSCKIKDRRVRDLVEYYNRAHVKMESATR